MSKRILFQFDCDAQPSTFDAVVAVDSGVDHLIQYGNVFPDSAEPLVHGTMFTRGGDDLRNTAIFLGGSNVSAAEQLLHSVIKTFFGPVRVSVMMDANGCNTTAAAAVVAASRHIDLRDSHAVVLGGTGPVGQRAARLLAGDGAHVTLTSRTVDRAQQACDRVKEQVTASVPENRTEIKAAQVQSPSDVRNVLSDAQIIIACGAAGVQLAAEEDLASAKDLKVAIDLNAVPPAGLAGISAMDKAKSLSEGSAAVGYGAIGVGGLKMKTHRAAVASLFESNDKVLDAEQIYSIAKDVEQSSQ